MERNGYRMMGSNLLGYLAVPVWPNYGGERRLLRVFFGEEMLFEYLVPFSGETEEEPAWYAYLPIQRFYERTLAELAAFGICQGRTPAAEAEDICRREGEADAFAAIRIETEDARLRETCFFTASPGEVPETERPSHHFAPPYGWMNDPNGLVFDGSVWHLYFQHNPMDAAWCNMTWGHAVSDDLVHFSWKGDVLFPDARGVMYSGCAVVNEIEEGVRVFPKLPKEALVFFYTSAGHISKGTSSEDGIFTQRVAVSLDGGETLVKVSDWELPNAGFENRDPKVLFHRESGALIMALYLDNDRFGLFRAETGEDAPSFRLLHEIRFPQLIECPDFFPLRDEETGDRTWAFLTASGAYMLGRFDGYRFEPETEVKQLYANKVPFAAQTFANAGGRVLSVAWLRAFWDYKTPWTGAMSLVREYTLARKEGEPYIRQRFAGGEEAGIRILPDGSAFEEDVFGERYIREMLHEDGEKLYVDTTMAAFPYPVYVEGETH